MEMSTVNALLPDGILRTEWQVIGMLEARGFEPVLLSHAVDFMQVVRDFSAFQVAVVQIKPYDMVAGGR